MVREIITIVCAVTMVDGVAHAEPKRVERAFEGETFAQDVPAPVIITTTGEAVS